MTVRPDAGLKVRARRFFMPQSSWWEPFRKKPGAACGRSAWYLSPSLSASGMGSPRRLGFGCDLDPSISLVIPVLVTGIQGAACSGARGWLDTGDKPRYDNPQRNAAAIFPPSTVVTSPVVFS